MNSVGQGLSNITSCCSKLSYWSVALVKGKNSKEESYVYGLTWLGDRSHLGSKLLITRLTRKVKSGLGDLKLTNAVLASPLPCSALELASI